MASLFVFICIASQLSESRCALRVLVTAIRGYVSRHPPIIRAYGGFLKQCLMAINAVRSHCPRPNPSLAFGMYPDDARWTLFLSRLCARRQFVQTFPPHIRRKQVYTSWTNGPSVFLFFFENGMRWLFLLLWRSMDECSDGRRALVDNRPEHWVPWPCGKGVLEKALAVGATPCGCHATVRRVAPVAGRASNMS